MSESRNPASVVVFDETQDGITLGTTSGQIALVLIVRHGCGTTARRRRSSAAPVCTPSLSRIRIRSRG